MSFSELVLNTEYRSSIALTSRDFYAPILKVAIKYDRAVGFFSSSSLVHIAEGLLPFVNNGGTITISKDDDYKYITIVPVSGRVLYKEGLYEK